MMLPFFANSSQDFLFMNTIFPSLSQTVIAQFVSSAQFGIISISDISKGYFSANLLFCLDYANILVSNH